MCLHTYVQNLFRTRTNVRVQLIRTSVGCCGEKKNFCCSIGRLSTQKCRRILSKNSSLSHSVFVTYGTCRCVLSTFCICADAKGVQARHFFSASFFKYASRAIVSIPLTNSWFLFISRHLSHGPVVTCCCSFLSTFCSSHKIGINILCCLFNYSFLKTH